MPKTRKIEYEIQHVLSEMKECDPKSEDYEHMCMSLEILGKVKEQTKTGPSPDAILTAVTYVAGLGLVIFWEQLHVLPKALSFMIRPKL